jgi:hypothetical protein
VLNIRGHSYRMRGLHADLRDDRLADDLKAAKGTYDRKTVGFKDLQRRLWSSMRRSLVSWNKLCVVVAVRRRARLSCLEEGDALIH